MKIKKLWCLETGKRNFYLCWDFRRVPIEFGGGLSPARIVRLW